MKNCSFMVENIFRITFSTVQGGRVCEKLDGQKEQSSLRSGVPAVLVPLAGERDETPHSPEMIWLDKCWRVYEPPPKQKAWKLCRRYNNVYFQSERTSRRCGLLVSAARKKWRTLT